MRRMLAMLFLLLMITASALAEGPDDYSPGDAVADFTLATWDGQEIVLSALMEEKDVVVLHFFSSGCGACEEEMPLLQASFEQYGDRVALVAVTIADTDTDKKLKTYCTRRGLTFPVARDTAGLAGQYPIQGVPLTFVIDRDGVLREIKKGAMADLADFAALVEPYLIPMEKTTT